MILLTHWHLISPLSCSAMAWIRLDSPRDLTCLPLGLPRLRRSATACSDHQRPSHPCATRLRNGSCVGEKSSARLKALLQHIAKQHTTSPARSHRVGTRPDGRPSGRHDCPRMSLLVPERTLLQLGLMQSIRPPLVSILYIFPVCCRCPFLFLSRSERVSTKTCQGVGQSWVTVRCNLHC